MSPSRHNFSSYPRPPPRHRSLSPRHHSESPADYYDRPPSYSHNDQHYREDEYYARDSRRRPDDPYHRYPPGSSNREYPRDRYQEPYYRSEGHPRDYEYSNRDDYRGQGYQDSGRRFKEADERWHSQQSYAENGHKKFQDRPYISQRRRSADAVGRDVVPLAGLFTTRQNGPDKSADSFKKPDKESSNESMDREADIDSRSRKMRKVESPSESNTSQDTKKQNERIQSTKEEVHSPPKPVQTESQPPVAHMRRISSELFGGSDVSDLPDVSMFNSEEDKIPEIKLEDISTVNPAPASSKDDAKQDADDRKSGSDMDSTDKPKKRRGRPPGSKNKVKPVEEPEVFEEPKPAAEPKEKKIRVSQEEAFTIVKVDKEEGILLSGRKRHIPFSTINNLDRSGRTQIFKYASSGDAPICKAMLEHGALVNAKDYAGYAPLHEACLQGHVEIVTLLLQFGADVNLSGGDGDTPLHDAVSNGHINVVEALLSYGANLEAENERGLKPIDMTDDTDIKQVLTSWSEWIQKVVERSEDGRTLLHKAAQTGEVDQVRELLKYGANVNAQDKDGWTPVHEAVSMGHVGVLEVLLDHGASPNSCGGVNKDTPLKLACSKKSIDCARLLLEYGANLPSDDKVQSFIDSTDLKSFELTDETRKKPSFEYHVLGEPIYARYLQPLKPAPISVPSEPPARRMSTDSVASNLPSSSIAPPSASRGLSREERKLQAIIKTIENMENPDVPALPDPFYGLSIYEAFTPIKPSKRGSSTPLDSTGRKKRGRPKKADGEDLFPEPKRTRRRGILYRFM